MKVLADDPAKSAVLLLPPRRVFAGQPLPAPLQVVFGRGQSIQGEPGWRAQIGRYVDWGRGELPVAALTREADCKDAADGLWLRADPAYIRADLGVARLLACGDLELSEEDAQALAAVLQPLFESEGFSFSAPHPARWYLRLPPKTALPTFADPVMAMGDDLVEHLPAGEQGRLWRRLLNETQVLLHQHPINRQREKAGSPAANSVWFWGGGRLPEQVRFSRSSVITSDSLLSALAQHARVACGPGIEGLDELPSKATSVLIDQRAARAAGLLDSAWIRPALRAFRHRQLEALELDFGDGYHVRYRHTQCWWFWRRRVQRWT